MKYTAFIAAALCAPLAMAQGIKDPAAVSQTQAVEAAINELCDIQVKIVEILESARSALTMLGVWVIIILSIVSLFIISNS